jgi:hypothetical protein
MNTTLPHKSKRLTELHSISADGRVDFTRGIHRHLQNQDQTVRERQTGFISFPKGEPVVFGRVYDVKQFGEVIGQAVANEADEKGQPRWQIQQLFGGQPVAPGLG